MGRHVLEIDFSEVAFRQAPLLLKLFACFSLFHSEQWNKKGRGGRRRLQWLAGNCFLKILFPHGHFFKLKMSLLASPH